MTDIVVTSSNAVKIVSQLPEDEKIIFGPDRNLGNYVKKVTGRKNMIIWQGGCHVHDHFDANALKELKNQYPSAKVLAHPECPETILQQADFVGATSYLLKMSIEQPDKEFLVATEPGIFYEMKKRSPEKTFIPVPNENGHRLNVCVNMKRNSLKKIYLTLKYEFPQVDLPNELSEKAVVCINRMMQMS